MAKEERRQYERNLDQSPRIREEMVVAGVAAISLANATAADRPVRYRERKTSDSTRRPGASPARQFPVTGRAIHSIAPSYGLPLN